MSKASVLTGQQEKFCVAFVNNGGNEYVAYKDSFAGGVTMKDSNIRKAASRLLKQAKVVARINQLRDKLVDLTNFGAADVVEHLKKIALADPNELVSYRRYNCRHCYGRGNEYQWVDENEFARAVAATIDTNAVSKRKKSLPTDEGGYGFKKHADPSPKCPVCQGSGQEALHIADTRRLSDAGRKLYAGVKKTKEGIEIKMHDQTWALGLLAKHFRVIGPDNVTNIHTHGGVTNIPVAVTPMDPNEAAKFYQDIMQGKK